MVRRSEHPEGEGRVALPSSRSRTIESSTFPCSSPIALRVPRPRLRPSHPLTFQQNHDLFFRASAEILEVRSRHRLDDPSLPREVVQRVFKASHVELAFEKLVARPEHLVF